MATAIDLLECRWLQFQKLDCLARRNLKNVSRLSNLILMRSPLIQQFRNQSWVVGVSLAHRYLAIADSATPEFRWRRRGRSSDMDGEL